MVSMATITMPCWNVAVRENQCPFFRDPCYYVLPPRQDMPILAGHELKVA